MMSSVTSTSTPSTGAQSNNYNQMQGNGLSSGMSSVGGGSPVSSSGNNHNNSSSNSEQLSRTNLYIRGLPQTTTDKDLLQLCGQYGTIISTKAILDKNTNKCKGSFVRSFIAPLGSSSSSFPSLGRFVTVIHHFITQIIRSYFL